MLEADAREAEVAAREQAVQVAAASRQADLDAQEADNQTALRQLEEALDHR